MKMSVTKLKATGACASQVKALRAIIGRKTVNVTEAICVEHAQTFQWDWAAGYLLSASAWTEYDAAIVPARAKYGAAIESAWAKYDAAIAPTLAEYGAAIVPTLAEYCAAIAPALAEYDAVKATALAEYDAVAAGVFGKLAEQE